MDLIADKKGFSRIEVVCMVGLSLFALALVIGVGIFMLDLMRQGNDTGSINNAESIARATTAGSCLVPDCPGTSSERHQTHMTSDGAVFAYFDKTSNCLTDVLPRGYNESTTLTIAGHRTNVEPGSMVIIVEAKDNAVSSSWVEGK